MSTVSDGCPTIVLHDDETPDRAILCLPSFKYFPLYCPLLGGHILAEDIISLFEVIFAPSSKFVRYFPLFLSSRNNDLLMLDFLPYQFLLVSPDIFAKETFKCTSFLGRLMRVDFKIEFI